MHAFKQNDNLILEFETRETNVDIKRDEEYGSSTYVVRR